MKKFFAAILCLVMLSMTASCALAAGDRFTIVYGPNQSGDQAVDVRNGMAADLAACLGMEVDEVLASDYSAVIEALRTGNADMGYMGALSIVDAISRADCEPIVMNAPIGDDGQPDRAKATYRSVMIALADDDAVNGIEDIKGKTFAFVDPTSTSGCLFPTAMILQAFPDDGLTADALQTNGTFFEAVTFSGSHQASVQAVLKGDVEIAAVSDKLLNTEITNGNCPEGAVKIIAESVDIPSEGVCVSKSMDPALKAKLVEFLTAYDNEDYFAQVINKAGHRFITAGVEDYQPVIELNDLVNGAE